MLGVSDFSKCFLWLVRDRGGKTVFAETLHAFAQYCYLSRRRARKIPVREASLE